MGNEDEIHFPTDKYPFSGNNAWHRHSHLKMDGTEATRRIKAELPSVHIVGLTRHDDEQLNNQWAGTEVTLSKTTSAAELVKAIYGRQLGR